LHGLNPGMGWLFAVALGLQEEDRRAVWRSLLPLGLGHAIAIAVALVAVGLLGLVVSLSGLKWLVAAMLIGVGAYKLARLRHPKYGGLRMSFRQLTLWSFLMASAHGAGLMVLPIVLGAAPGASIGPGSPAAHGMSVAGLLSDGQLAGVMATLVHSGAYLFVCGLIAVIVYEKLGLRLLRSAWVNLDSIWAITLIATGIATLLL
jgi:hypothetical protein